MAVKKNPDYKIYWLKYQARFQLLPMKIQNFQVEFWSFENLSYKNYQSKELLLMLSNKLF